MEMQKLPSWSGGEDKMNEQKESTTANETIIANKLNETEQMKVHNKNESLLISHNSSSQAC